jgi:hypothetical protein
MKRSNHIKSDRSSLGLWFTKEQFRDRLLCFCLPLFVLVGTLTPLSAQDETTHQRPLSAEEQQQVIPHLGRSFKDLVDIRRGPERFEAYLHPKLQFYGGTVDNLSPWSADRYRQALSAKEGRRLVALTIEAAVLDIWLAALKLPAKTPWINEVNALRGNPEELADDVLRIVQAYVDDARTDLKTKGAMNLERFEALEPLVRKFFETSPPLRELNTSRFGQIPMVDKVYLAGGGLFHFAMIDNRLQVLAIYAGD